MGVTSSTVPVVKSALVTVLSARTGLTGVQISYTWPNAATEAESIWLGDEEGTCNTDVVMGTAAHAEAEEYTIPVTVQVVQESGPVSSGSTTEARAFTLFEEVRRALVVDKLLGLGANAGLLEARMTARSSRLMPAQSGWKCTITCEIAIAGWIDPPSA
jgi:hypothetical protein